MSDVKCCICGIMIDDSNSNNPRPYKKEGRCCYFCDQKYVLPMRMMRDTLGLDPHGDEPYQWSVERQSSYIASLIRIGHAGKTMVMKEEE